MAEKSPMEEPQIHTVSLKLGKTHYAALEKWSKERFGLPNFAGMVRLILHEKWASEEKAPAAEGNGAR